MRSAVTGDGGWCDVEDDDEEPEPSPSHEGECELADAEGCGASHGADSDAAQSAGSRVEGPKTNRYPGEDGQREDCKREEQPGEEPYDEENKQWSQGDHGGGLREIKV